MGSRGPAPTPTLRLANRGSWRADTRAAEPQPTGEKPRKPSKMSAGAGRLWDYLAPRLFASGLLSAEDREPLRRYCETMILWRSTMKTAQATPFSIEDPDMSLKLQQALSKIEADLRQLERAFGMSPAARAAMAIPVGGKGEKKKAESGRVGLARG